MRASGQESDSFANLAWLPRTFVRLIVDEAQVVKGIVTTSGPPKPAMWDGMLVEKSEAEGRVCVGTTWWSFFIDSMLLN